MALSQRYRGLATKKSKMDFLKEVEEVIFPHLAWEPLHRKSLIRKLNAVASSSPVGRRGRKPRYSDIERGHLVRLWQLSGYPCSKRLKALLPGWLPRYGCSDRVKAQLLRMSASQMDAYLTKPRIEYQRKVQSGTVPAKNHIKKLIRLREPGVRHQEPGFCESDTVLHCSHYIWGSYAHTVGLTDLYSGWTEGTGVYGKNAAVVLKALQKLEGRLPFKLLALFFDNGIEYVNHLLVEHYKISRGVDVARGRSGRSNDQCHIEQKNHTFVRQLFGHVRIEDPSLIPLMNEIYEVWGLLHNYFMPQMKLISKDRINGKVKKIYDNPKIPYERLMECTTVAQETKDRLTRIKAGLDPFKLQADLQEKLARFHQLNDAYNEKIKAGSQ
jgi:hypothetical protein